LIELSGETRLARGKSEVLEFLSDPKSFAPCVGTIENLQAGENGDFTAKFKIGVPKKYGIPYLETVSTTMSFKRERDGDTVEWQGAGRTLGTKLTIVLRLILTDEDSQTHLRWQATLKADMIERLFGEKNLREIATELATQILDCISSKS